MRASLKTGGIGTYYRTLSEKLTESGWYVILLVCSTDEEFGGKSHLAAVQHIFSTHEIKQVLNLQPVHLHILANVVSSFDYESFCCLFFTQALTNVFQDIPIYSEFHEMTGFGYRTMEAKKCNLLPSNCVIGVTIHSGHEWIYEANDWYAEDYPEWFSQICDYEQYSFENADLAFFPSYHLKSRVETYQWQTAHAEHMPYFIPVVYYEALLRSSVYFEANSQHSQILGMITIDERNYAYNYAKNLYIGKGEIVELGCWLGSFTISLAVGLQENSRVDAGEKYIHAYDLFEWASWMDVCVENTRLEGKYKEGDSFLDAFLEQIEPWKKQIKFYPGDLNQMRWKRETPIEYLLVDAMKSWELTNSIIQTFFPALVPGLSLVHHQDFVHYYTSWIHLIMYRFKDYFEPVDYVPIGSFVFKYKERIPLKWLETTYSFNDFAKEEIDAAFAYSMSLVPSKAKSNVAAAKAMLYVHLDCLEEAQEQIRLAQEQGLYLKESEFSQVEMLLQWNRHGEL